MKHLSQKIALSLIATTVTLPSITASVMTDPTNITSPSPAFKRSDSSMINFIDQHADKLKEILLEGIDAKKAADVLRAEKADLESKLEHANQELTTERQSTWQRFKNWIFNLEPSKVLKTVVGGIVTIVATVLTIVL